MSDYDVKAGGVQRVCDDTPGQCWMWVKATSRRSVAVHVSIGPPWWLIPSVGRTRNGGFTEWIAGWLLVSVQVAHRPSVRPATTEADADEGAGARGPQIEETGRA